MASDVAGAGGCIPLRRLVGGVSPARDKVEVALDGGTADFDAVMVCVGLGTDTLARSADLPEHMRIIPFRGEHYELTKAASGYVRGLVYPVPDPRFPFLGVHLTRSIDGRVHIGPNAMLALALEGYCRRDVALSDVRHIASWPGFWRMAAEHYPSGVHEVAGSLSKRVNLRQVHRYVSGLRSLRPGPLYSGCASAGHPAQRAVGGRLRNPDRRPHLGGAQRAFACGNIQSGNRRAPVGELGCPIVANEGGMIITDGHSALLPNLLPIGRNVSPRRRKGICMAIPPPAPGSGSST
jgi:hypothetical protein